MFAERFILCSAFKKQKSNMGCFENRKTLIKGIDG